MGRGTQVFADAFAPLEKGGAATGSGFAEQFSGMEKNGGTVADGVADGFALTLVPKVFEGVAGFDLMHEVENM
ncbi:hypothetical protein T492DRAFT_958415 [Pavlovales sp. CCMP2436]|nr:hypothetical protein T492DRAFT_958415 [Pavlovales sp. CCMP2436]